MKENSTVRDTGHPFQSFPSSPKATHLHFIGGNTPLDVHIRLVEPFENLLETALEPTVTHNRIETRILCFVAYASDAPNIVLTFSILVTSRERENMRNEHLTSQTSLFGVFGI